MSDLVWIVPIFVATVAIRIWSPKGLLLSIAPGLLWFLAFLATGDRRLFFCYTIYYAIQLGCLLIGERGPMASFFGGTLIVGLFLAIRAWQDASLRVLLTELLVAAGILSVCTPVYGGRSNDVNRRAVVASLGSLLAFAGLAL